ncbi:MAG: hypothetical protein IT223_03610 [Crocinitomicaceae bacterium]|nr:hypothetical protein [Crocinitomicaceae bacterium]
MQHKWDYPQYRRLTNGKSYYRIDDDRRMTEIQIIGTRWGQREIIAQILPDRILIDDLLHKRDGNWETITADEYHLFEAYCKEKFRKATL